MIRQGLTGSRIRERRLAQGLRQADLARDVGISPAYLNLIEHNRRRIGGKLLVDIARQLGVEASVLTEGAEAGLLEALREAAAAPGGNSAETDRTEEFAGRYPGWAALLATRHRRVADLERTVETLSDRLTHDPFLSASMHEVLSVVTAIRSTAAILAETEDIDRDWQARFHSNLREDSRRLAEGTQALVAYLDEGAGEAGPHSSPQEEVEYFLARHDHHFPELEAGGDARAVIRSLVAGAEDLASGPARQLARRHLARYAEDAAALPLEAFAAAAAETGADPDALGARFGADPMRVFRRLATLPAALSPAPVGLIICDGSGTLTFRKPLAGFALPRFGAACPLWPLYQALSRPSAPVRAEVEMPSRPAQRFLAYAICAPLGLPGFSGPQVLEAAMLILPAAESAAPALALGTSCRICPRGDCPARREPSILQEGL